MRRIVSLLATSLLLIGGLSLVAPLASSSAAVTLPTVVGGFNQTPKITFPSSTPPSTLQVDYLHKGTGKKVVKGQLLVANYLGQIWKGKVFDSSFSRGQLSGFPIGIGEVIKAWDTALVGAPIGSEMLLVVPPADGYGATGNTGAGITGTDTLVFVVDVVAAYGMSAVGDAKAVVEKTSVGGISVTGKPNKEPTIAVKKGTKNPTAVNTTLLDSGHGAKITAGLVVLQLVQTNWSGKVVASTWSIHTPYAANIGVSADPSIFDKLIGLHLGSRVLIELPELTAAESDTGSATGPYALVVDVVAEPHDGA